MKSILVLGIGNCLMMDDGIGVYIVEGLSKLYSENEQISFVIGETDFDYCLDVIEDAEYIILVDAVKANKPPGMITIYPLHEIGRLENGLSMHQLHFLHYIQGRQGELIGIEPFQIDFQMGLSEGLKGSFEEILSEVARWIQEL